MIQHYGVHFRYKKLLFQQSTSQQLPADRGPAHTYPAVHPSIQLHIHTYIHVYVPSDDLSTLSRQEFPQIGFHRKPPNVPPLKMKSVKSTRPTTSTPTSSIIWVKSYEIQLLVQGWQKTKLKATKTRHISYAHKRKAHKLGQFCYQYYHLQMTQTKTHLPNFSQVRCNKLQTKEVTEPSTATASSCTV